MLGETERKNLVEQIFRGLLPEIKYNSCLLKMTFLPSGKKTI
jgi:hypothetical protein